MADLHRYSFPAMGSDCVLHLFEGTPAIAAAAELEVARIEARYSRYREDSYLTAINRVAASGGSMEVDAETAALIDFAFACYRRSGGLFDITTGVLRRAWNFSSGQLPVAAEIERLLPYVGLDKVEWQRPHLSFPVSGLEVDFGGIGKEYAADCAARVCREAGVKSGLVDLGGDFCAIRPYPDGSRHLNRA